MNSLKLSTDRGTFGKDSGIFSFLTIFTILSYLFTEIESYDVWWHVVIGTDILKSWTIPSLDIYTIAGHGRPYFDSHWLFQVVLAVSHKFFRMTGVQLVMVVAWSMTFIFTFLSSRKNNSKLEICLIVLLVVAGACSERFIVRPELATIFFIAFYYWLLNNEELPFINASILLLVSQVLWTNSHGLFVIGPLMVGCHCAAELIKLIFSTQNTTLKKYSIFLCIVFLGSVISPLGIGHWEYAILLFHEAGPQGPDFFKTLGELSPTFGLANISGCAFWFYSVLVIGTLIALGQAIRNKRFEVVANSLILTGVFIASLSGRRNMALFAIVAGPFVSQYFGQISFSINTRKILKLLLTFALFFCLFVGYSGKYFLYMNLPTRIGFGVTSSFYPHGLPSYLSQIDFQGNILNSNILGGFYLYHAYPERLPLTDGRWEIYDHHELKKILSAARKPYLFRDLVDKYKINGLLLQHMTTEAKGILPWIESTGKWKMVYLDFSSSFWVPFNYAVQTTSILDSNKIELLSDNYRVEDLTTLGFFYRLTSRLDDYTNVLQNLIKEDWETEQAMLELGKVMIVTKRYKAAEEIFLQLVQKYPDNIDALFKLAFLAYSREDFSLAESYLNKVFSLDPEYPSVLLNIELIKRKASKGNSSLDKR